MPTTTLLCTDGSDLAIEAIRQALPLIVPADRTIVVTVSDSADPALVTGTGFAGGVMAPSEYERISAGIEAAARQALDDTVERLGLEGMETMLLQGRPGFAICDLAEELPATLVVIGTHGRAGFRRTLIGSTSDHIVRHAICPVMVQGAG